MNDFSKFVDRLKNEDEELKTELNASDKYAEIVLKMIESRKAHKITQAQVAAKSGLAQSAVARLERMEHYARADTLIKALTAVGLELGVSVPGGAADDCKQADSAGAGGEWIRVR